MIVSPEQLTKYDGGFERLFKRSEFMARILGFIFDEGHCISTWGSFRPEYRAIEQFRHTVLKDKPFAVASATLSTVVRRDIIETLHLRRNKLIYISRSTDRPNVHLIVRQIQYPLNSFLDLACVLPKDGSTPPKKFLIFFDSITDTVNAVEALRRLLPLEHRGKIIWYHSEMSEVFKREEVEKFKRGETWGICATDSFGMVSN